jgi:hypothetical protein
LLAETTGFEPAKVFTRRFSKPLWLPFHHVSALKFLERAVGFEPTMIGFADQRLEPLGYTRVLRDER